MAVFRLSPTLLHPFPADISVSKYNLHPFPRIDINLLNQRLHQFPGQGVPAFQPDQGADSPQIDISFPFQLFPLFLIPLFLSLQFPKTFFLPEPVTDIFLLGKTAQPV